MRRGLLISLIFHVAVAIIAYLGVPYLHSEPFIDDVPIFVDFVNAAEETNAPPPKPALEPKVRKAKELPILPSEPAVESESELKIKPEIEVAKLPPEPKHTPKPELKPEPKVLQKPKVDPKPKSKIKLSGIRPPKKPKPPDAFASVLKTLEDLEKTRPKPKQRRKPEKKEGGETAFEEAIEVALKSNSKQNYDSSLPVSMSETDAIRKHFQRCWNVPAGAKGAEGMVVELEIRFLQDGSVRSVKVLNSGRMRLDSFYRITAEAAQRAVLHPKCNKLSMPLDKFPNWHSKYQKWQKMTLVFDPKDMF